MPARGYEFYLLVFKSISHERALVKFISTRGHVISSISLAFHFLPTEGSRRTGSKAFFLASKQQKPCQLFQSD